MEPGKSVRRGTSRVVERSDGNIPAGSGNLDGGRSDEEVGGSARVRSVRARPNISREREPFADAAGKEDKGGEKGDEKGA